jgi:sugar/nucleoside kinase (ribokinase family)
MELLRRVDVLLVNDAEARQLSGDWNIYRAARWILKHGPQFVVVKQGEYGAVLVSGDGIFYVPAYPLEQVFDPTGAGDSFAGGFLGHLAATDDTSMDNLRRAMVFGSAMGSFAVEEFSIQRFDELTPDEVHDRVRAFGDLVRFDLPPLDEDA